MAFFETSAKSNLNVSETFNSLTNQILESNEKIKGTDKGGVKLGGDKGKDGKKKCC